MSPDSAVIEATTIEVPVAAVRDALHAGLRQGWTEAEAPGVKADLTCGAGLGSPYMILSIERPGKDTIQETISVTDFLPNWIEAAIARADARAEAST